jgi:large subunit ribosomal protein L16
MLRPKKTKFKKTFKSSFKNCQKAASILSVYKEGAVIMKSLQFGRIFAKQFECCSQAINKKIKKYGKLQSKKFPDLAVTKKPKEVRMGKGKGTVEFWAFKIKPGNVLFEVNGMKKEKAFLVFSSAGFKLSVKIKIIA